jgi:putative DNA primase/helicase
VGQGVRIIDVPTVSGQFGLFTDLHGAKTGSVFSDNLRSAAAKYYGHAGPLFVKLLIDKLRGLTLSTKLEEMMPDFGDDLNAQEGRVARAFALVALAGELAIAWGILPWQEKDGRIAAVELFDQWQRSQLRSDKGKEYAQMLTVVRDFIEVRGADFSDAEWTPQYDPISGRLVNPEPVIHERAGDWKEIGGKRIYLFNTAGLKRASSGFEHRKVAEVLDQAGALIEKTPGRRTKKLWIPQLKESFDFYWIDPEKLELNNP